jgi:hypothetical protein
MATPAMVATNFQSTIMLFNVETLEGDSSGGSATSHSCGANAQLACYWDNPSERSYFNQSTVRN